MMEASIHLRKRARDSHKGENGRVLLVGGSVDYAGAVYLAAMAALRSGVDNVTVAAPEKVAWVINSLSPDLITVKFKGEFFAAASAKKIVALSKKFDVVVIGNGIGTRKETKKFAAEVIRKAKSFKVVDADAIKAVRLQDVSNAIITPHRREFEILLKNSGCGEDAVRRLIGNNVIIVKGAVDKIISKDKTAFNRTGNAGMTVSGTGDVLAGLAAGILAQEKGLWKAAVAAAYVSGKIGDSLFKKRGYGFTASDMLELVGKEVLRLYV